MIAGTGGALLGERLVSGAASGALSLGMVLALVGLSGGGAAHQAARPALATFDVGARADGKAGKDSARPEAKPPSPPEPPADTAPPPARMAPAPIPIVPEPVLRSALLPEPAPQLASSPRSPLPLDLPPAPQGVLPAKTEPTSNAVTAAPVETNPAAVRAHPSAPGNGGGKDGGYKAEVWRHLQRYRRPNAVGAGSAFVRFAIGAGGRVLDLAIARSSGSRRFDGEALTLVRRAQPFPLPPSHQESTFIFEIKGS